MDRLPALAAAAPPSLTPPRHGCPPPFPSPSLLSLRASPPLPSTPPAALLASAHAAPAVATAAPPVAVASAAVAAAAAAPPPATLAGLGALPTVATLLAGGHEEGVEGR